MSDAEVDLIYSHLVIRSIQLLRQCPREWRNLYQIKVNQLYGLMNQWKHIDDLRLKTFTGQLMLAATRSYEGYDYYYNPLKTFYFRHDPLLNIIQSTDIIRTFMNTPPQLNTYVFKPHMLIIIKNILKQNKAIISIICDRQIFQLNIIH
ncbi:hypothetical protein pb186bvf_005179 [Paramecium bursaria]